MVDIHHIAVDGISIDLLIKDFMRLLVGQELPALKLHYRDFSEWQNKFLESEEIQRQQDYWLGQYSGELPVLRLPTDYPNPGKHNPGGHHFYFVLETGPLQGLQKMARDEEATLFMVLLAIYNILLSKISGQEDILVGTALAGRRHADLAPIIGMFLNTLPLRNYPAGNKTFKAFLQEVTESTLIAFENQDYPFEELAANVAVKGCKDRKQIFNAAFGLQNAEMSELRIPGLKLEPYPYHNGTAKFDMNWLGMETGEELCFDIEYSTTLFKQQTIENFTRYFKRIVSTVLANPDTRIKEIPIISRGEEKKIIAEIREDQENDNADFSFF
jgi:hypothetical protein